MAAVVDLIYVHIDLDVLDPAEIPGHPLTAPDGPTGAELGAALEVMFRNPSTVALGLASYPHTNDPGGITIRAVRELVAGAMRGIEDRTSSDT
jgi:arginase